MYEGKSQERVKIGGSFFFNDTATTEIYTLSLHDALPIWFGILLMVLLETALITPPIGINLYVVQGIRKGGPMTDVIRGALPFVVTMFVMLALLLMFPQLALWLPSLVY